MCIGKKNSNYLNENAITNCFIMSLTHNGGLLKLFKLRNNQWMSDVNNVILDTVYK